MHVIQEGWKHADKGVNAFRIDQNWNKPTDGQSRQGREFGCTEPLQYPEYPPPRGQTHTHGRWISEQGSVNHKWVSYLSCNNDEILDLPPNMAMSLAHWRFQKLPNGIHIHKVKDIVRMISDHRTAKGLITHQMDPTGPVLQPPHHKPSDGGPEGHIPSDISDRTPLRYTTSFKSNGDGTTEKGNASALNTNSTPSPTIRHDKHGEALSTPTPNTSNLSSQSFDPYAANMDDSKGADMPSPLQPYGLTGGVVVG